MRTRKIKVLAPVMTLAIVMSSCGIYHLLSDNRSRIDVLASDLRIRNGDRSGNEIELNKSEMDKLNYRYSSATKNHTTQEGLNVIYALDNSLSRNAVSMDLSEKGLRDFYNKFDFSKNGSYLLFHMCAFGRTPWNDVIAKNNVSPGVDVYEGSFSSLECPDETWERTGVSNPNGPNSGKGFYFDYNKGGNGVFNTSRIPTGLKKLAKTLDGRKKIFIFETDYADFGDIDQDLEKMSLENQKKKYGSIVSMGVMLKNGWYEMKHKTADAGFLNPETVADLKAAGFDKVVLIGDYFPETTLTPIEDGFSYRIRSRSADDTTPVDRHAILQQFAQSDKQTHSSANTKYELSLRGTNYKFSQGFLKKFVEMINLLSKGRILFDLKSQSSTLKTLPVPKLQTLMLALLVWT